MTTISFDLPDIVLESYQQNIPNLIQDIKQSFIIWEYTNGKLSLKQSADALNISYREFVELLWSRGISIDALNKHELNEQYHDLIPLVPTLERGNEKLRKRKAGLGKGNYWMSDDFDEELSDEFWLGNE